MHVRPDADLRLVPAHWGRRPLWRLMLATVTLFGASTWSLEASAYQWMLRHGYTACGTCHTDPSGAGILEPYGAFIADEVLRTHYSEGTGDGANNPGEFAGGQIPLPNALRLKGDVRGLWLTRKIEGQPLDRDFIWMQTDFAAALRLDNLVASASIGYSDEGATRAAITRKDASNVVSRQHWLGIWALDNILLVRAGRMNLPFGVRTVEHTLWVRDATQTTINDDQAHGLSVHLSSEWIRGEVMAIAGNYQERPDDYRERGYSGYLEWPVAGKLALGACSLVTHRELDSTTLEKVWRHAHGVFVRWATPFQPLVVTGELDYVLESPRNNRHDEGIVAFAQADFEVVQGIHLMATGETQTIGIEDQPASYAGWLSYAWFFAPHADVRIDSIYYALRGPSRTTNALAFLTQFHVYL